MSVDSSGAGALAGVRWAGWVLDIVVEPLVSVPLVVVPLVVAPLVTAPLVTVPLCGFEGLCVSVSSCDRMMSRPAWCIMCM